MHASQKASPVDQREKVCFANKKEEINDKLKLKNLQMVQIWHAIPFKLCS